MKPIEHRIEGGSAPCDVRHVPTFGEWGWVLASPRPLRPAAPLPPALRSLTDEVLPQLFVFPPDMSRVPAAINRLNDQQLVRYYDEEWQRWVH